MRFYGASALSRLLFTIFVRFVRVLAWSSATVLAADDDGDAELAAAREAAMQAYKRDVAPFIKEHCGGCPSGNRQKGGVTFQAALNTPASPSYYELWKKAAAQLKTHNMPPDHEDQPSERERQAVVDWIAGMKFLSPKDPGEFIIRRLNRTEYGNTLHDLLGVDPKIAAELPDEVFGAGYTNSLSPLLMEQYLSVANDVLNRSYAPPGSAPSAIEKKLFGAPLPAGADARAAVRETARALARKGYRRPPSEAEVDLLVKVFDLAKERGKADLEALRLMLKAILVSPQFLFIMPNSVAEQKSDNIVPLDDYR